MRYKIVILAILTAMVIAFSGCAELIKTEEFEVEATITDTWIQSAYTVPLRVGQVTTYVRYPAKYVIEVEYEDLSLSINNKDLYDTYHHRIGETVTCTLVIQYYGDGSIYRKLKYTEVSE